MYKLLPALAAVPLALSACGSDDSASGSGDAPDVADRSFVSTEVEGPDAAHDAPITIAFTADSLSAHAGCNTMTGGYSFDGSTLEVEALATTEMACEPDLMDQDAWLAGYLTSGPTVALDGDELTISTDDTTLTMLDVDVAVPAVPLEGTTWLLDGTAEGDTVSSVPSGVEASLLIEGANASVDTGCNAGMTTVQVSDTTLTFEPMAVTLMLCEEDANTVQDMVLRTLAGEVTYAIEGDRLAIENDESGTGLTFVAAT